MISKASKFDKGSFLDAKMQLSEAGTASSHQRWDAVEMGVKVGGRQASTFCLSRRVPAWADSEGKLAESSHELAHNI